MLRSGILTVSDSIAAGWEFQRDGGCTAPCASYLRKAAGVTDRLWEVSDLVALLEASERGLERAA